MNLNWKNTNYVILMSSVRCGTVHVTVLFVMLVCEENKVEKHWFSRKLFNYVFDLSKSLA